MAHLGCDLIPERRLKSIFPDREMVDFVLREEHCTVLIECESTELAPLAKLQPDFELLRGALSSSMVAAMKRIYSTASKATSNPERLRLPSRRFLCVIVTYKDLYLGSGRSLWDEFLEERMSLHVTQLIDPNDLFVVSLEDFESLVSVSQNSERFIGSQLCELSKSNRTAATSESVFSQQRRNPQRCGLTW